MATTHHTSVMCFDYPVNREKPEHSEQMEKLSELMTAGWKVQGSPYIIRSNQVHSIMATDMQVLLVRD